MDTRRARGTAIGIVCAIVVIGGTAATVRATADLDSRSARKETSLKATLPETDPLDLLTSADASALIGEYREIKQTPDGGVEISVELRSWWLSRCVIAVRPPGPQPIVVRSKNGAC